MDVLNKDELEILGKVTLADVFIEGIPKAAYLNLIQGKFTLISRMMADDHKLVAAFPDGRVILQYVGPEPHLLKKPFRQLHGALFNGEFILTAYPVPGRDGLPMGHRRAIASMNAARKEGIDVNPDSELCDCERCTTRRAEQASGLEEEAKAATEAEEKRTLH